MDYAIDAALSKAGARNAAIARGQIDREKLVVSGEEVIGLDAQITALKSGADTSFLFTPAAPQRTGMRQGGQEPSGNKNDEINAAFRAALGKEE